MNSFFEGLNILISTFCVCANGFQGLLKAFHCLTQILTFYCAFLKLLTNFKKRLLNPSQNSLLCDWSMFYSADLSLAAGMNLQNRRRLPVSIFSVKIAALGSLKRVTGRIFIISSKFLSKDQAKTLILIFSSTKKNKIVKTLSACTVSTEITYLLLKAFSKNIHLVAQSFRHKYSTVRYLFNIFLY
jgi:hypothetical protein